MRVLPLILPLSLLLVLGSTQAQQRSTVYQWTDAKGVTQYSETPPTKGQAAMRRITARDGVAPQSSQPAPLSTDCTAARSNLELLNSGVTISKDTDGDGRLDTALTAQEREDQKQLATAAARVHCPAEG